MPVRDSLSRPLRDLRISVTDRCNFRCTYCMPREVFGPGFEFLHRSELLSFEEIARLARVFVDLGVEKIRITGGEPLLRRDITTLVALLAAVPGLQDLTLTTNGVLLPRLARPLREAGLGRVTVSLDSLDGEVFGRMNDAGAPVVDVLAGIEAAREAGLTPVKVNAVVQRGVNDHTLVELAEHFRGSGHILRLIEYMDVGNTNGWRLEEVVPAREMVERIDARFPLEALEPNYPGEVARRFAYRDGAGEIGVIASVTQPFCGGCTRLRLSPEGRLYTCLFSGRGFDLREVVRSGASDGEVRRRVASVWEGREDRYSEARTAATPGAGAGVGGEKVEMSHIGG